MCGDFLLFPYSVKKWASDTGGKIMEFFDEATQFKKLQEVALDCLLSVTLLTLSYNFCILLIAETMLLAFTSCLTR